MIKSYDELTLGKWLELKDVDTEQEEIDVQVDILSILSDMTPDEITSMPLAEYQQMVQDSMFLAKEPQIPDKANKLPESVKINGKDYIIQKKVETMTAGQYIDYQTYLKSDDLPHILSCFIIPKGKKYGEGYDIEELVETLKEYLPIQIAIGISRFFFTLWANLMNITLDYSIKQLRKTVMKDRNLTFKQKLVLLKSL